MRYETIGNKLPWKDRIAELLLYAGHPNITAQRMLGRIFLIGLDLGIIVSGLMMFLKMNVWLSLFAGISTFIIPQALVYVYLAYVSDRRASDVNEILPDALQLMSANIRAGMTTDRAIWLSARPEFGPLETEIKRVSSKVLGGDRINEALRDMTERINSDLLGRAVKLMIEGIESGGEMATLLEETASDIRTAQEMKKKVKSNVTMYSMFIIFASVLGGPLLFSISLYFIEITSKLWGGQMSGAQEGLSQTGASMISMGVPQLEPAELRLFALVTIGVTTFFGGLIIGLIQEGKATKGLKYAPFMVIAGIGLFLASKFIITTFFGGFMSL